MTAFLSSIQPVLEGSSFARGHQGANVLPFIAMAEEILKWIVGALSMFLGASASLISLMVALVMISKGKPKDYLFSDNLHWVLSPTSGKLLIAPKEERNNGGDEDGDHRDDESEVFYSVKSCFSRCSSDDKEVGGYLKKDFHGRSIWEEFCYCEGWPFGLFRRALMLPPLPSSPSDSWTWRGRKLVTNVCSST